MERPVLLVQLSDLHVGADWEGVDPVPRLRRTVEAVLALPDPVDAVLVSGDLTDDGGPEDYRLAKQLLDRFPVPVHVLPGNHDDRAALREAFGLPGEGAATVDYAVEVGELRLVVVDSTIPGQDPGGFEPEQLRWLDAELAAGPDRPTLLAMHHSPLPTGMVDWDSVNLPVEARRALGEVVAKHPQVLALTAGHLHRATASSLGGRPVLSAPSTYLQARPEFIAEDISLGGPPGFALHALRAGELSSQVESVAPPEGGEPS